MKSILLACTGLALAGTLTFATVNTMRAQVEHKPTAHHTMLLEGVGHWESVVSMPGPDGETQTTQAWENVEAVGPYFTKSNFRMAMGPGQFYTGHGVIGYDTTKGKFVGTWMGSMDPYLAVMEGDLNDKTGVLTMRWDGYNMMGEPAKHHYEYKRDGETSSMQFFENGVKTWRMDSKRISKTIEAGHKMDADAGHDADGAGHSGDADKSDASDGVESKKGSDGK